MACLCPRRVWWWFCRALADELGCSHSSPRAVVQKACTRPARCRRIQRCLWSNVGNRGGQESARRDADRRFQPERAFRPWLGQILKGTRLTCAVVTMALHFAGSRWLPALIRGAALERSPRSTKLFEQGRGRRLEAAPTVGRGRRQAGDVGKPGSSDCHWRRVSKPRAKSDRDGAIGAGRSQSESPAFLEALLLERSAACGALGESKAEAASAGG